MSQLYRHALNALNTLGYLELPFSLPVLNTHILCVFNSNKAQDKAQNHWLIIFHT